MELSTLLARLKLDHLEAGLDGLCEQAATRDMDYKTFLEAALATEWQGRHRRGIEARLRQARLPWIKTLEQFDFDFQPSIDRRLVRELSGMGFVERAANVVVLGPPGVGKTHIAVALGVKAVESGYSVLFLTLESLMSRLTRARAENRLDRALQQLSYPRLLILDEIGYLPLTREDASLFFRLLVRRYERASLIVTSNKSFIDWGEIFGDHVLATPSSTASCTTLQRSTSRATASASRRNARPASSAVPLPRPPPPLRSSMPSIPTSALPPNLTCRPSADILCDAQGTF